MPAKDLGNKHVCFKCSTKFYDMKKPDPLCPKCGADQRESPALKAPAEGGRRGRLSAAPKIIEPAEPPEEAEVGDDEEVAEFEDEDAEVAADDEEEI
jgi:hypothetical protein